MLIGRLKTKVRNSANRATRPSTSPITLADRLSENGSSRPSTSRLIARQPIGISMVSRLITTNDIRPPSEVTGGRSRNAQCRLP